VSRLDPERIRHVASPLIELGCALHVLAEPRHHGRTEWAAGVRLPAVLREEVSQWTWTVRAVRARFFATSAATGLPTWQDELKALRARTPYIAPHLFLGEIPGEPLTIIYPAAGRGPAVPTAQQVRSRLEALAAPDRLQVCRAVASESRTAGEIAALWGLHPTQVTRHLRALTRAGLVTAERQGRFVAYRLDEDAFRNLGAELLELIMR
jgi:DNA-binding transcriptional ArsR family regulator